MPSSPTRPAIRAKALNGDPAVLTQHAQFRQASLDLILVFYPVEKAVRLGGATVSRFELPGRERGRSPRFGVAMHSVDAQASVRAESFQ